MEEEKTNYTLTKKSTVSEILETLNSGLSMDQIAKDTGIRKSDLINKVRNAGIEEREPGLFIAISEESLAKEIGSKIYDFRKIGKKGRVSKEQLSRKNLDQLNSDIRKYMITEREKPKQYTPSKEVWRELKALQKYLFNVQQDWLIDALVNTAISSIEFPDEFREILTTLDKEKNFN